MDSASQHPHAYKKGQEKSIKEILETQKSLQ